MAQPPLTPEQLAAPVVQQESPIPMPAAMPTPMAPLTPMEQNGIAQSIPLDQGMPIYTPQQQVAPVAPIAPQAPDLSGFDKITKAGQKAMQLGMKAAQEENALAEGYMQENEKFMKEQDDILQAKTQAVQEKQLEVQQMLDKVSAQEIDPDRVFDQMSTGKKVGMFILSALAGSRGAETLNRMVDNDIKAQVENKNSKIEAIKGQKSLYADLLAQHKDVFAAKSALKAMQYQAIQMKINALGSQTKNADFQLKLAGLNNDIEANKQKALGDFAERTQKLQAQQSLQAIDPVTAKIQLLPESAQKPLLEAKEVYDATQAAFKTIDNIFSEAKDIGFIEGNIPFSDAKANVEANSANIESAIRATMKGQGTIQEAEIERLVKPLLPLPSDSKSRIEVKKQKLKQLLQTKNAGQIGRLQNMGLLPKGSTSTEQDLLNKDRVK